MTTDTKIALLEPLVTEIKLNNVPSQGFPVVINAVNPHGGDEYRVLVKGSNEVIGTATGNGTAKRIFVLLEKAKLLKYAGKEVDIYYILTAWDTGNEAPSEPTRYLISLA